MEVEPQDLRGRPLVKTRYPGVYKRGSRYVAIVRIEGRPRKFAARTLDEARRIRAKRQSEGDAGEFFEASRLPFRTYATEWVGRYHGRGRRGFRESTRHEYRRDLERYAFPYFDAKLKRTVAQISPRDIANFLAWLCDEAEQGARFADERRRADAETRGRPVHLLAPIVPRRIELADATVRRILSPVRACLATAVQEGLIRHNPTTNASLPHRPTIEGPEEEAVRALTRQQLRDFLLVVHPRHCLLFRVLAATGVRVSEAIALTWDHLALDGSTPHLKVRRALVRGVLGPPKSRHGRRDIPLDAALVFELRARRAASEWPSGSDLVFPATNGNPLRPENVRRRVLKPAVEEIGAPWAGFHTFRHTCASLLFASGRNAVQVQRWLGHHSPAFTLSTYVHLLDGDLGAPLELENELSDGRPLLEVVTTLENQHRMLRAQRDPPVGATLDLSTPQEWRPD